jgi:hypothetical protein
MNVNICHFTLTYSIPLNRGVRSERVYPERNEQGRQPPLNLNPSPLTGEGRVRVKKSPHKTGFPFLPTTPLYYKQGIHDKLYLALTDT